MLSLRLQGIDGELDIKLFAMEFSTICSPVAVKIDVDKFPHLHGLHVARNFDTDNELTEMLVGVIITTNWSQVKLSKMTLAQQLLEASSG